MKGFIAFVVAMISTFSLLSSQDLGQITPNTISSNSASRLITIEDKPVIKATDGNRYLAKAEKTFKGKIDTGFKEWNLDQISHPTPDTPTNVYKVMADATFAQIFGSLSNDLNKLCLTQDQIEEFCLSHRQLLNTYGDATLFLFKEKNDFFVASVKIYAGDLYVYVHRLGYDRVWGSYLNFRVFIPQL